LQITFVKLKEFGWIEKERLIVKKVNLTFLWDTNVPPPPHRREKHFPVPSDPLATPREIRPRHRQSRNRKTLKKEASPPSLVSDFFCAERFFPRPPVLLSPSACSSEGFDFHEEKTL
jgi:hypothetical protein